MKFMNALEWKNERKDTQSKQKKFFGFFLWAGISTNEAQLSC
jgi:hypothetical protein